MISGDVLVAFELAHLLIFLVAMCYVATGIATTVELTATNARWDKVQFAPVESALEEPVDPREVQFKIYQSY